MPPRRPPSDLTDSSSKFHDGTKIKSKSNSNPNFNSNPNPKANLFLTHPKQLRHQHLVTDTIFAALDTHSNKTKQTMAFLVEESKFDPVGSALFDAFFDVKTDDVHIFDDDLFLGLDSMEIPMPETLQTSKQLAKKRKSLDWDLKPMEPSRTKSDAYASIRAPAPEPPVKRKRGRPRKNKPKQVAPLGPAFEPLPFRPTGQLSSFTTEMETLSNLFLDTSDIKPVNKELLKARKSEDWSAKPIVQQPKRRLKWSQNELRKLWEGIAEHGNNWTEIRSMFTSRSYCQIKDKGRRCLFLLGWETGRSKVETDSSNIQAKQLAREVLVKMSKA